jgi:hypothetical protein
MQHRFLKFCLGLFWVIFLCSSFTVSAQNSSESIECGQIIDAELTKNELTHDYMLLVPAGTTLNISIEPKGNFNPFLYFFDSGGNFVADFNSGKAGQPDQLEGVVTGSTNPFLRIIGARPDQERTCGYQCLNPEFTGAYTLYFGCIINGTRINAGDTMPTATPIVPTTIPTIAPDNPDFFGFPGISSVNFNNGVFIPFNTNAPNAGGIAPGFDSVFGFTLDANAGDIFEMAVTRISGNLNLGVVILSTDNKVVFYGGLITSESLATRLTLPTAGQYTIGVFRVDLLPPDVPEATAFQVTGTLNP